ncbi:hypothetical protein GE061_006124 [Apolygus lucorum]|uniref:Uncharacterized protein n=1 Tax=Apolygus lucorum TaxID=248454 RepID=A0A8S9WVJ1_APOLU|nr:hypothetical protein GE061_006124 [Apolygus lucorum]
MEYQHQGPDGATIQMDEEPFEPCSVGTVLLPGGRKTVANNNLFLTQETTATLPSTSLAASVAPNSPFREEEDLPEPLNFEYGPTATNPRLPATPSTTPHATLLESEEGTVATNPWILATPPSVLCTTPLKSEDDVSTTFAESTSIFPTTCSAMMKETEENLTAILVEVPTANVAAYKPLNKEGGVAIQTETPPAIQTETLPAIQTETPPAIQTETPSATQATIHQPTFKGVEQIIANLQTPPESECEPTTEEDHEVTTTENATADTGPLRPELEEMNEELAMEDDERTRWDRNVQDGDSRKDLAVPGTSGTTETKEEVTATEMESDDETFLDAMTLPPATTGLASSPDHLDNATPSQPPNNTEVNEDRESGTPRRTYGLRQRAPVDYRKLHLGALVQTDHNQTIMTQRQLELEEDMEGDPPFDEFVQQILDTFQEETEANETIPRDTVTTPEPCTFPEQTLAGIVNCIRHAARSDIRLTRIANGQAAVVHMLRIARWIPQYQRIAQERDELLEREEKWRTERAEFLKTMAAENKQPKEQGNVVKPETTVTAAKKVRSVATSPILPPRETSPQASGSGLKRNPRRLSSTTSTSDNSPVTGGKLQDLPGWRMSRWGGEKRSNPNFLGQLELMGSKSPFPSTGKELDFPCLPA